MTDNRTEIQRDMDWLDVEDVIERDIDRAAAYAKKADANLWVAGMYAARAGRYTGAIQAISERSGKSLSSIENWLHAYELYRVFMSYGDNSVLVRRVRQRLTISHFWTAWELQRKYQLSDGAIFAHLQQMLDYRRNGHSWSSDTL